MNCWPIWRGSGWVYRLPLGLMTTTKSVPVSVRTRSATGCSVAVGSGRPTASDHRRGGRRPCGRPRGPAPSPAARCCDGPGRTPPRGRRRRRGRPPAPADRRSAPPGSTAGGPRAPYRSLCHRRGDGELNEHNRDPSSARVQPRQSTPRGATASDPRRRNHVRDHRHRSVPDGAQGPHPLALHRGGRRRRPRRPRRVAGPRPRQGAEGPRDQLRQPHQDDDLPGHLLHDRPGHRVGAQGRQRRPRRRASPSATSSSCRPSPSRSAWSSAT